MLDGCQRALCGVPLLARSPHCQGLSDVAKPSRLRCATPDAPLEARHASPFAALRQLLFLLVEPEVLAVNGKRRARLLPGRDAHLNQCSLIAVWPPALRSPGRSSLLPVRQAQKRADRQAVCTGCLQRETGCSACSAAPVRGTRRFGTRLRPLRGASRAPRSPARAAFAPPPARPSGKA